MRKLYASLALLAVTAGLLLVPLAAHAVPGLRTMPPPGAQWWAPLVTSYRQCESAAWNVECPSLASATAGGWVRQNAQPLQEGSLILRSTGRPNRSSSTQVVRTTDVKLGSPFISPLATSQLRIPLEITMAGAAEHNEGAGFELVAGLGQSRVFCATTEYPSGPGTARDLSVGSIVSTDVYSPPRSGVEKVFRSMQVTVSSCPRISAMSIVLRVFDDAHLPRDIRFEWTAEGEFSKTKSYIRTDSMERICQGVSGLDVPECLPYRGDFDPVDFARVCAGAPSVEWLSFAWVGPTVGHYAQCLFRPLGGWDDDGVLAESLNGSAISQVGTAVTSAVESFRVAPSCGPLITAPPDSILGAFSLSTCDWNSWAGLLRTSLYWLVIVSVTLWAIKYFLDGLESILDRKGTSPVSTSAS